MFEIRKLQIKALNEKMMEKDVAELATRLANDHPKEVKEICPTVGDREYFIRNAQTEAFVCGILRKEYVYLFSEVRLLFGIGFHESHDKHRILSERLCDESIVETKKGDFLSEELALHSVFS